MNETSQAVSNETINEYCKKNGITDWFLCSAKTGENIEESFSKLIDLLYKKEEKPIDDNIVDIDKDSNNDGDVEFNCKNC